MRSQYDNLRVTVTSAVAEIVIDRDDIRNALAPEVRRDLLACLQATARDEGIRAIVLTGVGKSFCAGGSIRSFKEQTRRSAHELRDELGETVQLFRSVSSMDKPIVAAVNGHALGGGCALAIACDITLASDRAKFGFPEISRGFVPALASVVCLQRTLLKRATELLLTAETIDATSAVDAGLATRVVPHDELLNAARGVAHRIAGFGPNAVRTLKQLIGTVASVDREDAFFAAREVSTLMRFSEEFASGVSEFLARDKPG